jgi:maleylpyruvate isomerase
MPSLVLDSYWRSTSAWRVRIALHLKGVPFELRPVHLLRDGGEQRTAAHGERNPMRQIPVLEVHEHGHPPRRLTQSLAILAWLDAWLPEPPLLPPDPWQRARAWELAEIVNSGTQPLQNMAVLEAVERMGGDRQAWARDVIDRGLRAMETLVERAGLGPHAPALVGDTPTVADLCLVPQLYNARRFGLDPDAAYPRLAAVERALVEHPAFVAAHPDRQPDAPAAS